METGLKPLSLYVHWPFCLSKCPYCDFNSHVSEEAIDHGRWRDALLSEMAHFASETKNRALSSIFFGGGTPSLMQPDTVAAIISEAKRHWSVADIEITAEANPTSVEADKLEAFRDAGINRLSLGVQSFDDNALKYLGREHSSDDATNAISLAKRLFPAFSFDLIYARAEQTADDWQAELEQAFSFEPPHISLYQLSIEPGTPFHKRNVEVPENNAAARLFELTQTLSEAAGLPAYEISNHARPGYECRHNLGIWDGQDYIGIGPGAHGRLGDADDATDAIYQIHDPARWLSAIDEKGHATAKRQRLSPRERLEERVMTGLRTSVGIGPKLTQFINGELLAEMIQGGFLAWADGKLSATPTGRLVLDAVIHRLLSD
ncbi:MAG: coproporphyrinogen III oxidase [Rhodospirillaceae bacterium]|jgi:putative oxygen-independent coproporphyrinogen III oxidase|nr:coproporphyrinogen III oxidase [Rhodospirillaceae bacterium]MBT4218632.1 coproporphyrinogen III oxidase [Rhodospirillaceae bacterium]MBT4464877.1 coproporphyrinogen III oxidase [Rhodospirillaceae bacterium]MBT5014556.1 coproporphyrinogen III oxidase [Rhodospirillaceae bacterium]MBT5308438.1 coproporphyrinogen III oxidase [Rhodospirillaceae bacterium]